MSKTKTSVDFSTTTLFWENLCKLSKFYFRKQKIEDVVDVLFTVHRRSNTKIIITLASLSDNFIYIALIEELSFQLFTTRQKNSICFD